MSEGKGNKVEHYLDKRTFFDNFNTSEMLNLIRASERCFYEKGSFLFKEGDESDSFYIICNGEIQVELSKKNGDDFELIKLGTGNIIGEVGFLDGKSRTASARCLSYSGTLSLNRNKFQEISENDPKFALKIAIELGKIVSERLRWSDKILVSNSIAFVPQDFLNTVENLEKT